MHKTIIHRMNSESKIIEHIFSRGGRLARAFPGFEFRSAQPAMAGLIAKALAGKTPVIIEAGTGVGKTMGYLIPLLVSGMKAVVSTGTKNLQEQIFFNDIPNITGALNIKVSALLMKGRKNYLCLHRFHQHFSGSLFPEAQGEKIKEKISNWLQKTESGDRAELKWLRDDDSLWDILSSSSHQCVGQDCLHRQDCFIGKLHRLAARADIVVVNHHLFFADMMVKKGGFGEIIPRSEVIVFDEAHKIEEIATTYLGERLSSGQLLDLVQDAEKDDKGAFKNRRELEKNLLIMRTGVEKLERLFTGAGQKGRLDLLNSSDKYREPLSLIKKGLVFLQKSPDSSISGRSADLENSLNMIFSIKAPKGLDWYEKGKKGITFNMSPLDISNDMKALLYSKVKSVVFTSATISTKGTFDYIRSRLGIPEEALEGSFPSHFDMKNQTLLYVPSDITLPDREEFSHQIGDRIIKILSLTSGRALILFTSYSNLNNVYKGIREKIPFRIFRQGDAPRTVLLERFRKDTHSVLMATGSFWQGVDVPGETLSCLIIDKLPFDSPGEPLVAARIDAVREKGGNPFMDYQLPNAIIAFRQGLGRLIRKGTDRGVLAILDARIIRSGYGKYFIQSLPGVRVSHELEDIGRFFKEAGN